MRLLVCGGRDFSDMERVRKRLNSINHLHPITTLIHGAARGADLMAKAWADDLGIPTEAYHADWQRWGKGAGPERNGRMLREGQPDMVAAFPGGRGTDNMIMLAENAGVKVVRL